jgi:hypothetical protein
MTCNFRRGRDRRIVAPPPLLPSRPPPPDWLRPQSNDVQPQRIEEVEFYRFQQKALNTFDIELRPSCRYRGKSKLCGCLAVGQMRSPR